MGEVIEITDGDTITLIDSSRIQHKIRLAGIDAPEKRQAFGEKSKQQLADLVFRREVLIEWSKSDRYGRIIGKVFLGNKDVNLTQITSGMAWHYKRYANEQSMTDRGSYAQAEEEAKLKRRGLWKDQNPTPPWDFRHHR
ncbi:thermonuclease family protein [uncultured Dechloromonas sp.]|uniref:thermonuclease family protein n=1 Tax=uncultured Dechloromonas sp. TaxID=171719 RepID=UPI0025D218F6|nr:thermonuclease family protein [uncultured Dechloromonas sp.]